MLKEEYRDLPGLELRRLAQSGVTLKEWSNTPQSVLTFLGDTTVRVFDQYHPELLGTEPQQKLQQQPQQQNQVLVVAVECTFYQTADVARAAHTRHMHWHDLQRILCAHPQVLFLLQHFSVKHSDRQWYTWIREHNQNQHNNNYNKSNTAHIMLPPPPRRSTMDAAEEGEILLSCNCFVCCRSVEERAVNG